MYKPVYSKKRSRASAPVGVAMGAILVLVLTGMGIWMAIDPALDPVLGLSTEPPVSTASVPRDTQPPQIYGVSDRLIYAGDAVSYLSGITAADDMDPEPRLEVDAREVDLSRPGSYTVTYTAADSAGNLNTAMATITVLPREPGYVDLDTIYTLADRQLAILLEGTVGTREQVEAIYTWARTDIRYAGHSDRADWRQTAYNVIMSGEGDCFGFFAATKLMFERLGIPNIDVQKVRNFDDDSDHFWSLVSIDGGETYYHFDATPRYGSGDDFCLVTDAYLNAYSEKHKGSHNRDEAIYPATPEEDL